jgi:hypothetical protein
VGRSVRDENEVADARQTVQSGLAHQPVPINSRAETPTM